jgi:tungstate transport system substrate-binding protein
MRTNFITLFSRFLLCLTLALSAPVFAGETLRLASTTSTEATGLFKYILPAFEKQCVCRVSVIAVGTGKALKLGENGDVDVVLVHSRADEDQFIAQGFGVDRRDVMYNDFVIVGPASDPAKMRNETTTASAMLRIRDGGHTFISRGDESGTHKKELALWKATSIAPKGAWYLAAGQGMSEVLLMASERGAYTLSDRSTYLTLKPKIELEILFAGDPALYNPYGVIAVNPTRFPDANYRLAKQFIDWLTSKAGQQLIASFSINGKPLFFPLAGN